MEAEKVILQIEKIVEKANLQAVLEWHCRKCGNEIFFHEVEAIRTGLCEECREE